MTLTAALLLDALIGDPPALWSRLPHPVVLIGQLIAWLELHLNRGSHRRAKGIAALLSLLGIVGGLAVLTGKLPYAWAFEIALASVLLAHRSLIGHVSKVAVGLDHSIEDGRLAVSEIVGRDPQSLDEHDVARAAIESAAENFSDGVVAPAFWFLVAGLPGIAVYKAVNTADSMIGYRNDRYREFGWASARLDDLLNLVPSRLTGLLFCAVSLDTRTFAAMVRDAPHHRSPNAGWPEAAMGAALGLALAGPRRYGGEIVDDALMNKDGLREATSEHIQDAVRMLWKAWGVLFAAAILLALASYFSLICLMA